MGVGVPVCEMVGVGEGVRVADRDLVDVAVSVVVVEGVRVRVGVLV